MRIIISPAKKMREDTDSLAPSGLPDFLPETQRLLDTLRQMDARALQKLWGCNDAIAALNLQRLERMDLERNLTPALLSYEGIQYQYMAPGVFESGQFAFLQEHLRILSGFYGILRPFDGVTPYRLEMQAKLRVGDCRDLYAFWGDKLARQLAQETGLVVNLASKEYSRAVESHLPASVRMLTCVFGELQGEKVVEKGTICKMARGRMVRWLAEQGITQPEGLLAFQELGYRFSPARSSENRLVYIREP